jgi:hypothetical protein
MNADHLRGNLQSMKTIGTQELEGISTKSLFIQPGGIKLVRNPDL